MTVISEQEVYLSLFVFTEAFHDATGSLASSRLLVFQMVE